MICNRKNFARSWIEHLQPELILDGNPALLAEDPVQMNGHAHVSDAVLGKNDGLHVTTLEKRDQIAHDAINLLQIARKPWITRPKPLQVVIKVRQVNERKGRLMLLFDPLCG